MSDAVARRLFAGPLLDLIARSPLERAADEMLDVADAVAVMRLHVRPERAAGVGDALVVEVFVGRQGDEAVDTVARCLLDPPQLNVDRGSAELHLVSGRRAAD